MERLVRRPTSGVSRMLMLAAAVAAVIAGMLGMHSVHPSDHLQPAANAVAPQHHGSTGSGDGGSGPEAPPAHEDGSGCAGTCGPGHSMAMMLCLLALLVAAFVLARAPWSTTRRGPPVPAPRFLSARLRATEVLPRPPSPQVLCISRT